MKFLYKDSSLIPEDKIQSTAEGIKDYVRHIKEVVEDGGYDHLEASANLPFDESLKKDILNLADKKRSTSLKHVVVLGIGGSNLGTKAIYDALRGEDHIGVKEDETKILFLETLYSNYMRKISAVLEGADSSEDFLIVVISKSGSTTETIANFEMLFSKLVGMHGDLEERVVVITDEGSKLWRSAEEKGIDRLPIPRKVGGRYSVFSAVGLFPLAVAGIDIEELLSGAGEQAQTACLTSVEENPSLAFAVLTFLHYREGKNINNTFLWNPALISVGRWYRQLMGESIGKEKNISGNVVNEGITPIVSIGSTDLHSMAQLFFGGPNDKFTTHVFAGEDDTVSVPEDLFFPGLVEDIEGKSSGEILEAIYAGVKKTYEANNLPYAEVLLSDACERELGSYLQFKMMEMMYLARLLDLNAFNQPNVEEYKDKTRQILKNKAE